MHNFEELKAHLTGGVMSKEKVKDDNVIPKDMRKMAAGLHKKSFSGGPPKKDKDAEESPAHEASESASERAAEGEPMPAKKKALKGPARRD